MTEDFSRTIIFIEGLETARMLKRILQPYLGSDVGIAATRNPLDSISRAHQTLHAQETKYSRVILVMNADRDSRNLEYARLFLGEGDPAGSFRLISPAPQIEGIFFQDKRALEIALDFKIEPTVWELSLRNPKDALEILLKDSKRTLDDLLNIASFVELIRRAKPIQEILEFLQSTAKAAK